MAVVFHRFGQLLNLQVEGLAQFWRTGRRTKDQERAVHTRRLVLWLDGNVRRKEIGYPQWLLRI